LHVVYPQRSEKVLLGILQGALPGGLRDDRCQELRTTGIVVETGAGLNSHGPVQHKLSFILCGLQAITQQLHQALGRPIQPGAHREQVLEGDRLLAWIWIENRSTREQIQRAPQLVNVPCCRATPIRGGETLAGEAI
jgi:hypothetical protein